MTNWFTEKYKAKDLVKKIQDKEIRVPPYQRGQVWNQKQEEKLIDSIKRGFPFGTILLYQKGDKTYQLIDGLQRSTTIFNYLNSPAKFFDGDDISEDCLKQIYKALNIYGNQRKIEERLKEWVVNNHSTMQDILEMNLYGCAEKIKFEHPNANFKDVFHALHNYFKEFKNDCLYFSNTEIPAIVYTGDPRNLPEVFNRINSKGTILSKYQILAATWSYNEYKIQSNELLPIIDYVNKFYSTLEKNNFGIDGYNVLKNNNTLNLYQILFGFSKLISNRYPYLFIMSKRDKDVESCAFNLVNACVGNKNNKLSDLSTIIERTFENDKSFNRFLCNILNEIDEVYKKLKPYLEFKLNKRNRNISIYHTELQICSIIANRFNARYCTYTFDDKENIIGRSILLEKSKENYDDFKKKFKKNFFKKYLIDLMNDKWKGTGDAKLDEVSLNRNYYADSISRNQFETELDHWYKNIQKDRREYKKVASVNSIDKILLSVIYCHNFSAYEQNDEINYDIEHLAPKGRLKIILKDFNLGDNSNGLAISSFANLCLLPEQINRKKKEKTLYQDDKYLQVIDSKQISIQEVESKFSFTTKNDLEWINIEYHDFEILKRQYIKFLDKRFIKQKKIILDNLFRDENNQLYISKKQKKSFENTISNKKQVLLNENSKVITIPISMNIDNWQKDVYSIINKLPNDFYLSDLYEYVDELSKTHQNNHHIKAKIRQILQQLREKGYIEFLERGHYRKK